MIQPPYTTGTATVTAGSAVVTGQTTAWVLGLVSGGLFTRQGLAVPILSVESDTSLTLAYPWPGASGTSAYAIDLGRADAASSIVANRRLAELLVGIRGPLVEFRESPDGLWLQYRNAGSDDPWENVVAIADLEGQPASFAEVLTQTLSAGANATADVVETSPGVFSLRFGIPRGATGDPAAAGSIGTTQLANAGVTNAKLANMASGTVKMRRPGTAGAPTDETLATLRTDLGAQPDLGWKPIARFTSVGTETAAVFALPTGTVGVRVTGVYLGRDLNNSGLYARLSTNGGGAYLAASTDYVYGSLSVFHTATQASGTASGTFIYLCLPNGDAILPSGFDLSLDTGSRNGFLSRFRSLSFGTTNSGAAGSQYRYETFGFARTSAAPTHLQIFTSDGTTFRPGTVIQMEAY